MIGSSRTAFPSHATSLWKVLKCVALSAAAVYWGIGSQVSAGDAIPETPRVESLVMLDSQPHQSDAAVIWYDDFDDVEQQQRYPEKSGELVTEQRFGDSGRSLEMHYPRGSRGIGGRKVFFGDSPTHRAQAVRRDESFQDVYWRIYVKHPHDWTGGGAAKLSRATSLVSSDWQQAMIAHVWSSGEALTLDPASGVRGDSIVTRKYNDFENLRWLGNKPATPFQLHGADGTGWWVCVEARAKLNTPGQKDGLNQLWMDGRLESERSNLDWRGSYDRHGINAVFLEAYWNQGSPVDQSRWIDNFVISTKPIGPVVCSTNPVLIKTPYRGPGRQQVWQLELATDSSGQEVAWQSEAITDPRHVRVGDDTGRFTASLPGKQQLPDNTLYYCRVRQQSDAGQWSAWSPWHQPFRTGSSEPRRVAP